MNYIIFDLEATCLKDKTIPFEREIIEIGAVKLNAQLEQVGDFTVFIKPVINPVLSDFCKELTTITQAEVDSAGTFKEGLQAFLDFIGEEDFVLLSWGGFDKNQLIKDCKLHSLPTDFLKNHYNLKKLHHKVVLQKERRPMGTRAALAYAGVKFNGIRHRGIDDSINITRVFVHHRHELIPHLTIR